MLNFYRIIITQKNVRKCNLKNVKNQLKKKNVFNNNAFVYLFQLFSFFSSFPNLPFIHFIFRSTWCIIAKTLKNIISEIRVNLGYSRNSSETLQTLIISKRDVIFIRFVVRFCHSVEDSYCTLYDNSVGLKPSPRVIYVSRTKRVPRRRLVVRNN